MITRMEKVAQDVVLTAARKAGTAPQSALDQQTFKAAFQAAWPIPDSARPMNDAINTAAQAASNCTTQDSDTWKITLNQFWHPAVREIVDEYLTAARHSFRKGESLEGSEILTDAVRTTLGSIAASRNWPHSTEEDLFSTGCPDCRRLLQSQPELGVPIRLLPAFAAVYSCVGQDRTAGSPFVRAGFAAGVPLQGCCQSLRVRERYIGANRP